jgi:pimeloyl-ACP methyl ester carboxylesterase
MELRHGRMAIHLHELSAGSSAEPPPLLLLHELGSSAAAWGDESEALKTWNGPVHALDFAGHGRSDHATGRCYTPEYLLIDADRALAAVGDRACVAGAGVGAYVAMLLAGARPDRVPAALLLPGRGLACGGAAPDFERRPESIEVWEAGIRAAAGAYAEPTDPFVAACGRDLRPEDYVRGFSSAARSLLFSEAVDPEAEVDGSLAWWRTAREASGGKTAPAALADALRELVGEL